jgi:hypothetical protein
MLSQGIGIYLGLPCGTTGARACHCTMLYGIACYNIAQHDIVWRIVVFLFYCIRTLRVWVCHLYTALKAHYYTFGRTVGGVLSGTAPFSSVVNIDFLYVALTGAPVSVSPGGSVSVP